MNRVASAQQFCEPDASSHDEAELKDGAGDPPAVIHIGPFAWAPWGPKETSAITNSVATAAAAATTATNTQHMHTSQAQVL